MSGGTRSADGVFGSFPYEAVITPATVAGIVIAVSQFLIQLATAPMAQISVNSIVEVALTSVSWIGFAVAVLAIVVSGARSDVLVVGAILTYVAQLLAILLESLYAQLSVGQGVPLTPDLFVSQLSLVVIVVGIGIGVNWIGVDVSLLD